MADFTTATELAALCAEHDWTLSRAMRAREEEVFETAPADQQTRMLGMLSVMRDAVVRGLEPGLRGMGGLLGGEARRMHAGAADSVCGGNVARASAYALGGLEGNAAMGRSVAAPRRL